jgi:hypothetical protein
MPMAECWRARSPDRALAHRPSRGGRLDPGGPVSLADHAVHALDRVDNLAHLEVTRSREVRQRDIAGYAEPRVESRDRVADGDAHGLFEVGVHSRVNPVGGGFNHRVGECADGRVGCVGLESGEPHGRPERWFERGQCHLAVALRKVRVPRVEVGAVDLNGEVER